MQSCGRHVATARQPVHVLVVIGACVVGGLPVLTSTPWVDYGPICSVVRLMVWSSRMIHVHLHCCCCGVSLLCCVVLQDTCSCRNNPSEPHTSHKDCWRTKQDGVGELLNLKTASCWRVQTRVVKKCSSFSVKQEPTLITYQQVLGVLLLLLT